MEGTAEHEEHAETAGGLSAGVLAATLPPELIKLVASHLAAGSPDLLAARATCAAWEAALRPTITQLRVRTSQALPQSSISSNGKPAAAGAGAGAGATTSLPRQLAAALQRLTDVTRVTVDLPRWDAGSDAVLDGLLRAVRAQPAVTEVVVRHQGSVSSSSAGGTGSGLQQGGALQQLQHVRVLRLVGVPWPLTDIWQQVAALTAASAAAGSSGGCLLHTLEISLQQGRPCFGGHAQACELPPPAQLPRSLRRLVTPLPGQRAPDGSLVSALPASHEAYVRGLAAGLPGLTALQLGLEHGCAYEGNEQALLAFPRLQELRVRIGDSFRSFTSSGERDAAADNVRRLLASRLSALHLQLDWR